MKLKKLILVPVLSMVLSGCSTDPTNGFINTPIVSFNGNLTTVGGIDLLRNPSKLSHEITGEQYDSESFANFRNKMKVFSNKLSDLFVKRFFKGDKNFVLSPLSIEMCLGLAMRSTGGRTRDEILAAFDMDYDTFNTNFKLYFNSLHGTGKNNSGEITNELLIANSIWIDKGFNLKDDGLDALRDDYYCYPYAADFSNDFGNAKRAIEEFIYQNTKGLINPSLDLNPATLFVLMNVLYAKDIWNEYGDELSYASSYYQFTNSDGSKSDKQLLDGNYAKGKPIVTDDYACFFAKLCGYELYFVKPNRGKNLKDVFNKDTMNYVLDSKNIITQDDEKLEKYYTKCVFPEFNVSGDFDLKDVLQYDLGIESLFSPATCDMSGLTDMPVYCDDAKHLAVLDVNKKGIEGAAVTYMAYAGAAYEPYKEVFDTFEVNKEFGFILTRCGSVVFSGVINNID